MGDQEWLSLPLRERQGDFPNVAHALHGLVLPKLPEYVGDVLSFDRICGRRIGVNVPNPGQATAHAQQILTTVRAYSTGNHLIAISPPQSYFFEGIKVICVVVHRKRIRL